jgi:hypothetical protein
MSISNILLNYPQLTKEFMQKLKIKSIRKVSCDSKLYDIETAKNHNFFANGMLVHNSSATYYCRKDIHTGEWVSGICSRSLELKKECVNNYTKVEKKYNILSKLESYCKAHNVGLALRGEVFGSGIQGHSANPHSKLPLDFAAFSVFNFDTMSYENPQDDYWYQNVCEALRVPMVPTVGVETLTPEVIKHYAEDISEIDGKPFEGVVVKHKNGSFKILNMAYDSMK